jgi:hypothetical protein
MYQILLFHNYTKLNVFWTTHRPSSGAQNCTGSIWFFICGRLFVRVVGGRCQALPDNVHQLHVQTMFHVWETRSCQCSFGLLMMGGVSPETRWASYNCGIIKFDTLLHLVGFFFMNFTMMHGSTNVKFILLPLCNSLLHPLGSNIKSRCYVLFYQITSENLRLWFKILMSCLL